MNSDKIFDRGFWTGAILAICLMAAGAMGSPVYLLAGAILFGLTLVALAIERHG